jgi:hypothetical protein
MKWTTRRPTLTSFLITTRHCRFPERGSMRCIAALATAEAVGVHDREDAAC